MGLVPTKTLYAEEMLTDAKEKELNVFFSIFSNLLHDEYDINENKNANDSLLQFAIFYEYVSYALFYCQNSYDANETDIYKIPHSEFAYDDVGCAIIPDSYIDSVLLRFFNISSISHHSLPWCEYKDGNYYFMPAEGEMLKYPKVTNLYNNGDGTYTAKIELYTNNEYYDDLPKGEQLVGYKIAIIQPYVYDGKDTYQLLYWKTAEKNTPIPVQEPLSNGADIAKINSFTSKNNQTKFNLDETIYLTVKTNSAVTNVRYEYRDNGTWKYDELYATIPISSTQTEKTWTTNFALTKEKIDAVRVIASNEHSKDIKVIDIIIVLGEEKDVSEIEIATRSVNTESTGLSYVFYTNTKGNDFSAQAQWQEERLQAMGLTVIMRLVNGLDDFTAAWNDMSNQTIEWVVIYCHGNERALIFANGSPTNAFSIDGKNSAGQAVGNINWLEKKTINNLHILSCDAGNRDAFRLNRNNVASAFAGRNKIGTAYGYDGNVSFGNPVGQPWAGYGVGQSRLATNQSDFHALAKKANNGRDRQPEGKLLWTRWGVYNEVITQPVPKG